MDNLWITFLPGQFIHRVIHRGLWKPRFAGSGNGLSVTQSGLAKVVATDVSGSRELVQAGVTGLLVPPTDAETLAQAILQMLDDPAARQRMAAQAQQHMASFTIQNAARYYEQVYAELAEH